MADNTGISGLFFGFDRLNAVAAGLENRLEEAAVDHAAGLGSAEGVQAVQRLEDGSLAPLDLTPGLSSSQRAYNQAARNAYIARTQLDAEAMASSLMRKNPLNPDGFKSEWEAYVAGTLKSEQNGRVGAALTLDLMKIGNQAYAGLSSRKLEYDRADQASTLTQRAGQVRMQAVSFAARTGQTDADEIKDAQKEYDSLIANLVNDKHLSRGKAEEMRVAWGNEITIGAFKKRVGDAYEQGKTPLGPGSLVDAQRVARELSMQAAEQLSMDPAELFKVLMGGAQASQQIKAAIVGEKREQMQMANEAYALQQRSYHIATEKALGTMLMDRGNGGNRPLFPGATGDDVVQGGEGPGGKPIFSSKAEMIQRIGASGAASLIARDQAWRKERERDSASADAAAKRDLQDRWSVAQPVTTITEDGPRPGLLLPGGKVVTNQADIDALTDNEILRFQYGSQLMTKLNADLKDRATADGRNFDQEISRNTAAIDTLAARILSSGAPAADLVKLRDMLRIQFNEPGLPADRQEKIAKMMAAAETRIGEVNKAFEAEARLSLKVNAAGPGGVALSDEERAIPLRRFPEIDPKKPSADAGAAATTMQRYADVLRETNMQVDPDTARWLGAIVQRGNISGGQSEIDLRKAYTLLDRIETMPADLRTAFNKEMAAAVPNWAEISVIGRKAMEQHNASGVETTVNGAREIRYSTQYGPAFQELWRNYQERKAAGTADTYTTADAEAFLQKNMRDALPQFSKQLGWIDYGKTFITGKWPLPPQMRDRFTEIVNTQRLVGDGMLSDEQAHRQAMAQISSEGWAPSWLEGAPKTVGNEDRVKWVKQGIEWRMEKAGLQYGKQALVTFGAEAMATARGMSFDDAWKKISEGEVTFMRVPGTSRVNIVTFDRTSTVSQPGVSIEALTSGLPLVSETIYGYGPRQVRDKTGKPVEIDIGSADFKQFHMDFTRDVFQRSREFDINIPIAPAIPQEPPTGTSIQGAAANRAALRAGTLPPLPELENGTLTIPTGSLVRERIAGDTATRRSLNRLLNIREENRAP